MPRRGPRVTVNMDLTLWVNDPQALHAAAPVRDPAGGQKTFTEDGEQPPPAWASEAAAKDASAVFRLWPQEQLLEVIHNAIPGVHIDGHGFGTVG